MKLKLADLAFIFCLLLIAVLMSCSPQQGPTGPQGAPGIGHNGNDGNPGKDGNDGKDAENCSVQDTADGATITCPDGSTANVDDGTDGSAAGSCSVQDTASGAIITCPDGSTATVDDGDSAAATFVHPCNDSKITLVALSGTVFYMNNSKHLTLLAPGYYYKHHCYYRVLADGSISY